MMKETIFLLKTLKEWCDRFDGIHVRYAYDTTSEYHIVEVDPESIRRGNEQYQKAELVLWTEFMERYPDSDLLICEPSKANNMSNCLFDSVLCLASEVWMPFLSDYIGVSSVSYLSKRSSYSKLNEYNNIYDYALAA